MILDYYSEGGCAEPKNWKYLRHLKLGPDTKFNKVNRLSRANSLQIECVVLYVIKDCSSHFSGYSCVFRNTTMLHDVCISPDTDGLSILPRLKLNNSQINYCDLYLALVVPQLIRAIF